LWGACRSHWRRANPSAGAERTRAPARDEPSFTRGRPCRVSTFVSHGRDARATKIIFPPRPESEGGWDGRTKRWSITKSTRDTKKEGELRGRQSCTRPVPRTNPTTLFFCHKMVHRLRVRARRPRWFSGLGEARRPPSQGWDGTSPGLTRTPSLPDESVEKSWGGRSVNKKRNERTETSSSSFHRPSLALPNPLLAGYCEKLSLAGSGVSPEDGLPEWEGAGG
jgi:hypothetical protein